MVSMSKSSSMSSKGTKSSSMHIIIIILLLLIIGILGMCIYKAYKESDKDHDTTKAFYVLENRDKKDITTLPLTISDNTKYLYIPYKLMNDLNTTKSTTLTIETVQNNDVKINYSIDLASVANKDKGFGLYKKCKSINIKYEPVNK